MPADVPERNASWTFCYRPKESGGRRRFGLGSYREVGLAEARRRVAIPRGEVFGGADPQAERQARGAVLTLAELCEQRVTEIKSKKKPGTVANYEHYLRALVSAPLRAKKADAVTRSGMDSSLRAPHP